MPIRAAVVGCGPIGVLHAETVNAHPSAELVGVCATSPARRDPLAQRFSTPAFSSLGEMLQNVSCDMVCIASPDETHVELTRQALEADKHVLCEKPLGQASQQAQELQELAARRDRRLGVTYNRRYGFGYRKASDLLSKGRIGNLRQFWLHVTDATPPPHVATRPDIMFWTLLTHHLDLVSHFCGKVQTVTARVHSGRDDQIVDGVNIIFALASGGTGTLAAAYRDNQTRTTERCEIVGCHGSIVVNDVTQSVHCHGVDPDDVQEYRPNAFYEGNAFYESLRLLIVDFINCLSAGNPPPVTARDAVVSMQLAEAVLRSHREGRSVSLIDHQLHEEPTGLDSITAETHRFQDE